jgi:hypothetical protein
LIGAALNTQAAPGEYLGTFGSHPPDSSGARYGRLASYVAMPVLLAVGMANEHKRPLLALACGGLCSLSVVCAAEGFGMWESAGARLQEFIFRNPVKKKQPNEEKKQ